MQRRYYFFCLRNRPSKMGLFASAFKYKNILCESGAEIEQTKYLQKIKKDTQVPKFSLLGVSKMSLTVLV